MRRIFRSPSLGCHQPGIERVGEPRYNFVLHIEEVGNGLVEAVGPQMIAGFGVDQLYIDPEPVAAALYRALQRVADVQFAADPLHIDRFALEGECGVARDNERAGDARQVRGQAFGHAIDKIVLLGIAANIRERKNNDGQMWRGR